MKKKFLVVLCVAMQAILLLGGVQTSFARHDNGGHRAQKLFTRDKYHEDTRAIRNWKRETKGSYGGPHKQVHKRNAGKSFHSYSRK